MAPPIKPLAAALLAAIIIALPQALPMLQPFIDPVNGIGGTVLSKGLPQGRLESPYGNAIVVWDAYAIPHVYAESPEAAAYALGWVQASQRLFQMDLYRRVAQGNLSSLVGEAGVENDILVNKLGMPQAIRGAWERILGDPRLQDLAQVLQAYARGVNDYMVHALEANLLPVEYRVLGTKPYPWSPVDSLALAKLLTLMLAWDRDDLVLAELVNRHGASIISLLDIVDRKRNLAHANCSQAEPFAQALDKLVSDGDATTAPVRYPDPRGALEEASTLVFSGGFSNNWVVSASLSPGGLPLVANDPHLNLQAPPIWFVVHVEAPGWNATGVTIPGSPLVIIGRTPTLAWGFTNVGSDFTDFYYYKWVDNSTYIYKGDQVRVEERTLTLSVWNPLKRAYETREYTLKYTVHGPLLEGPGGEPYAVAFTGSQPSLDVAFIWGLNKAGSVAEALRAQREYFVAPVQNLVVADAQGYIAYSPNGGYPKRANLPLIDVGGREIVNTGFLPYNGSRGEGEWQGLIPFDSLPILVSGPEGGVRYIATANSKPWEGECLRPMGWSYHDRFRTQRIYELLDQYSKDGSLEVWENQAIQYDAVDKGTARVVELILSLAPQAGGVKVEALAELEAFLNNPLMAPQSPEARLALAAATIFHGKVWETLYGRSENRYFLKVEMLEELVKARLEGKEWPERLLGGQSLAQLAAESLREASALVQAFYETYNSPALLGTSAFRYYNIKNPVLPLHYDRLPAIGGPFSVHVAPPAILNPLEGAPVEVGPSVQVISSLSTTSLYLSLPGGQSSNPLSPHYQDLYRLWHEGVYVTLTLGEDLRSREDLAKLVFTNGAGEGE